MKLKKLKFAIRCYMVKQPVSEKPFISPEIVFEEMKDIGFADQEQVWGLFLNSQNLLTDKILISLGTLDMSMTPIRVIAKRALLSDAAGVILVHNHPSGEVKPSEADIQSTKIIKQALNLLEIKLVDHLIIGKNKYYSLIDYCDDTNIIHH
ncbi:MAG: JAB domain-containing protein [Bacteroidales bacterium]